ncbi:sigma-70 family RNA polymerase sigma factor [Curtobacterium aetherium]|uniref:sigma-70 family RNA polymerase sigma factor n=1 Tax=Curtobacterium aetherium TaxID=2841594 RepID=UPI003B517C8A
MDLSTKEGIAAFYVGLRDVLHKVAASVLASVGAEHEAEDVVMTVVEELLKKRPTGVANAEAYVVAMVKRRAVDAIRARHPKKLAGTPDAYEDLPDPEDAYAVAEDALDVQIGVAAVWDAWVVLTEQERDVVSQVILRSQPQKEVAGRLGVTPARVSQVLSGALRKLRQKMEGVEH